MANDFSIQRGKTVIAWDQTTATITAGTEYTAPSGSDKAWIRIVSSRHSASSEDTGTNNGYPAKTACLIQNPNNITTSITFERNIAGTATVQTLHVWWEIIEYIGDVGGANEMKVLQASTAVLGNGTSTVSTSASSVAATDHNDCMTLITGAEADAGANGTWDRCLFASTKVNSGNTVWTSITRSDNAAAAEVSYVIIEWSGSNWTTAAYNQALSSTDSEDITITDVGDTSRAFLFRENVTDSGNLDEQGTLAFFASTTAVTVERESAASANQDTRVWVIVNSDTDASTRMTVGHYNGSRANNAGTDGTDAWTESITTVADTSNTSIVGEGNRSAGSGTGHPRGTIGFYLADTSTVDLRRGERGQTQTYRFSVVEWPTSADPVVEDVVSNSIGFAFAL